MIFQSHCHIIRNIFKQLDPLAVSIVAIRGCRDGIWSRTLTFLDFNDEAIGNTPFLWFSTKSICQFPYNLKKIVRRQFGARFVEVIMEFLL